MIKAVALLGAEGKDAERQMMDVYDLEKKIAEVSFLNKDFSLTQHPGRTRGQILSERVFHILAR